MAENVNLDASQGGKRTVTHQENNLDFSTDSEVDVTITELRHVENIEDVHAVGFGTGDSDSNEGRVVVANAVNGGSNETNVVTLHSYVGGGAGAPLDDDTQSDVDHVLIRATGY